MKHLKQHFQGSYASIELKIINCTQFELCAWKLMKKVKFPKNMKITLVCTEWVKSKLNKLRLSTFGKPGPRELPMDYMQAN